MGSIGIFQDKVIVITGGAGGISKCGAEEFRKQGTHVCIIDTAPSDHYVRDIADKATLEDFTRTAIEKHNRVGLPTWCCFWHPTKRVLSPAKMSALTAARLGS